MRTDRGGVVRTPIDSSSPSALDPKRRRLLFALGAGGAGAAAVAVRPLTAGHAADAATPVVPDETTGYRLSEHVQRYYRTTKL